MNSLFLLVFGEEEFLRAPAMAGSESFFNNLLKGKSVWLSDFTSTGQRVRPGGSACASNTVVWGTRSVQTAASGPHATCLGIPHPSRCPNLDIGAAENDHPLRRSP